MGLPELAPRSLEELLVKSFIDLQDATTLEPVPHVNKLVAVKLLDWIHWTQMYIEMCIHLLAYCSVYLFSYMWYAVNSFW